MKTILTLILILASTSSMAGYSLRCRFPEQVESKKTNALNYNYQYECQAKNGEIYKLVMNEVGLNTSLASTEGKNMLTQSFRIKCPTVRSGLLEGTYHGANIGVQAVLGGRLALTVNSNGGACVILSPDIGAGIELIAAKYTLTKEAINVTYDEVVLLD